MITASSSPFTLPIISFSNWTPNGSLAFSPLLPEGEAREHSLNINLSLNTAEPIATVHESIITHKGNPLFLLKIDTRKITEERLKALPDLQKLFELNFPREDVRKIPKDKIILHNQRALNLSKEAIDAKLARQFNAAQLHLSNKAINEVSFLDPIKPVTYKADIKTKNNSAFINDLPPEEARLQHKGALAATKGDWRGSMEDFLLMNTLSIAQDNKTIDVPFYAVFDGHAGASCARYLYNNILSYLEEMLANNLKEHPEKGYNDLCDTLKLACIDLGRDYMREREKGDTAGTTSVITLIIDNCLWVTNVGDSRAILAVNGKAIALSEDADPEFLKYQRGVWKRDQDVSRQFRVNGLALTRAVGHDEVNSGVSPRATLIRYPLSELPEGTHHLVMASDGLWDVATCNEAAQFIQWKVEAGLDHEQIAHALVDQALKAGTTDNTSVIVVEIKR